MIKNKYSLLIIISLILCKGLYAQNISYPEKYTSEIRAYLDSLDSEEFGGTILIKNLLNENHFSIDEKGIYTFFTLTSHSRPFILFYDGKDIDIKKEYNPDDILKQTIDFVNTHQSHLHKKEKVAYYKRIIETIFYNLNPPNMLPPPQKDQN